MLFFLFFTFPSFFQLLFCFFMLVCDTSRKISCIYSTFIDNNLSGSVDRSNRARRHTKSAFNHWRWEKGFGGSKKYNTTRQFWTISGTLCSSLWQARSARFTSSGESSLYVSFFLPSFLSLLFFSLGLCNSLILSSSTLPKSQTQCMELLISGR